MRLAQSIGVATPLLLALAIASTGLLTESERLSAGLSLSWVVLSIGQQALTERRTSRFWPLALLVILLLNVRGVVLGEGPRPVSHMDYILLVAAVMAGHSQSLERWRYTLTCICFAVASCGLLQSKTVWHHLTGTEIGYRLGFLLINQTALIAGLGCICGLAALELWRKPKNFHITDVDKGTSPAYRLIPLGLVIASGSCAVMSLATHSRAGAGLIPISLLVAWTMKQFMRHRTKMLSWMRRRWLILSVIVALLVSSPVIWLASPQDSVIRQSIASIYGSENQVSDRGRIDLWKCYSGLPFSGSNRFLYGVGYESTREMCPIRLQLPDQLNPIKPMSHAHNLPLQVWAESGSLGLGMLLIGGFLLSKSLLSLQRMPQAAAASAPLIYGLLFNLFELGMFKVPLLVVLFGTAISGALIKTSNGVDRIDTTGASAIANRAK